MKLKGEIFELDIIIPTYNEKENISKLIDLIENILKDIKFKIVVVDDNSPDGTADIVESLNNKYDNILILRRPFKLGLASAIMAGIEKSKGDIIAVIDADLQHPPELLPQMLDKLIEGGELIVASRYAEGGGIEGWNTFRRVISKGAVKLAHLLLPSTRDVEDPISGYFMFRRNLIEGLEFEAVGYKFLTELLVKRPGVKKAEVPYIFKPRRIGKSKLGLNDYYKYALQCLKLARYKPLKFILVGISGILVNWGILHILVTLNIPIPLASPVAIEISILNNFIWNDIWTFRYKRSGRRLIRCLNFHGTTLVGALLNYITLLTLIRVGFSYMISNLIGIFLGFIANYLFSGIYVWRKI